MKITYFGFEKPEVLNPALKHPLKHYPTKSLVKYFSSFDNDLNSKNLPENKIKQVIKTKKIKNKEVSNKFIETKKKLDLEKEINKLFPPDLKSLDMVSTVSPLEEALNHNQAIDQTLKASAELIGNEGRSFNE